MALWDGFTTDQNARVMVLAATNRPSDLDEAIPQAIEIGLPACKERAAILKVVLKNEIVDYNIDFDHVASLCDGYSGSDILELCKKVAYFPVRDLLKDERDGKSHLKRRPITQEDFEKVLATSVNTKIAANEFNRSSLQSRGLPRQRESEDYRIRVAINELSKIVMSENANLQSDGTKDANAPHPHIQLIGGKRSGANAASGKTMSVRSK
ncbi:hypothetical protein QQ045_024783 [Rhodiola kirilowii]